MKRSLLATLAVVAVWGGEGYQQFLKEELGGVPKLKQEKPLPPRIVKILEETERELNVTFKSPPPVVKVGKGESPKNFTATATTLNRPPINPQKATTSTPSSPTSTPKVAVTTPSPTPSTPSPAPVAPLKPTGSSPVSAASNSSPVPRVVPLKVATPSSSQSGATSPQPPMRGIYTKTEVVPPKVVSIKDLTNGETSPSHTASSTAEANSTRLSSIPPTMKGQPQSPDSIYLDRPVPFTLGDVAGKSFVVMENYVDNLPYTFSFDQNGISRLVYKGQKIAVALENGVINLYNWQGQRLAYFEKLASDPEVGLIVIGHSLNKNGKVVSTWLDYWQNSSYTPPQLDMGALLPYRTFFSWTSEWYQNFRTDGFLDYFIYDPTKKGYTDYYTSPFMLQNGSILIQDGNLFNRGDTTIETTFTAQLNQIGAVGRYRILEVSFSSSTTTQSPRLLNASWQGLIGNYWIGGWFRLLPNGKIEFKNGNGVDTGTYKIEGNRLVVTYLWEGKYPFTDIYLLDPTSGTIQNNFTTSFREIVSPRPIVKLVTTLPVGTAQQKQGVIKKLFIETYIHHLKRKHFY